jgi:carboxyl-terminal processing protease
MKRHLPPILLLFPFLMLGVAARAANPSCPTPVPGLENELQNSFPLALNLEKRNAVIAGIKTRIKDQYFDARVAGTDFRSQANVALEAKSERAFYDVLRAWIGKLDTNFSGFTSPRTLASYQTFFDRSFVGIGIWSQRSSRDYWTITQLIPGGSAANAGLRIQDQILAINGDPCVQLEKLQGKADSSLTLRVRSRGEAARNVTLKRVRMATPAKYQMLTRQYGRIASLWLPFVPEEAVFASALRKILQSNPEGLILDFRSSDVYDGQEIQTLLAHIMPGAFYAFASRRSERNTHRAAPRDPEVQVPIAVLQDADTLRVSPWLTAMLQFRAKTNLVGASIPTDPRAGASETLADGSELLLYSSRFVLEGDRELPAILKPDVPVKTDWFAFKEANDPYIQAALGALSRQR